MNSYSDNELIAFIKQGGTQRQRALRQLYKDQTLRSKVVRFVQNNSGNFQDGQDMYQEGLIVFDRNIREDKFRGETSLQGYLYSICRFLWMNQIRKQSKINLTDDHSTMDQTELVTPEVSMVSEERKNLLREVIAQLGERCQKILELWKLSYSMDEIAKQMGFSSAAMARKNKYRCHKSLMDYLEKNPQLMEQLKN